MKYTSNLLAIALSICTLSSYSQGQFINENISEVSDGYFEQVLPMESETLPIASWTGVFKIQKYNTKTHEWDKDVLDVERPIFEGVGIALYLYTRRVSGGYSTLFKAHYHHENLVKIYEVTTKFNGSASEPREIAVFDNVRAASDVTFCHSKDHASFAFLSYPFSGAPDLKVFDESFELMFEKELANPFQAEFSVTDCKVTNAGDFLIVGYRKDEADIEGYSVKWSDKYAVLKMSHHGDIKVIDFSNRNEQYVGISIVPEVEENHIQLLAFYGVESEMTYVDRVYVSKVRMSDFEPVIEHQFKLNDSRLQELDEFYLKYFKSGTGRRKNNGLAEFVFKDAVAHEDGGFTVIAERDYGGIENAHAFGEVLILNLDSDFKLNWDQSIRKAQKRVSDFNSYNLYQKDKELYLFYNEEIRNIDAITNGDYKKYRPSGTTCMAMVKVGTTGELDYHFLDYESRGELQLRPRLSQSLDQEGVLLLLSKGRDNRIVQLKL